MGLAVCIDMSALENSAMANSSLATITQKGPHLIGLGVVLFVVTRIVRWLPLGFVGTWINSLLWPVLILAVLAGAGMLFLRSKRSS